MHITHWRPTWTTPATLPKQLKKRDGGGLARPQLNPERNLPHTSLPSSQVCENTSRCGGQSIRPQRETGRTKTKSCHGNHHHSNSSQEAETGTRKEKDRKDLEPLKTQPSLEVGRTRKPGGQGLCPGHQVLTAFFSRSEVDPQLWTLTVSPRSPSLELWMEESAHQKPRVK